MLTQLAESSSELGGQDHVQTHEGPGSRGSNLDELAQLIRQPQASPPLLVGLRSRPSHEGVVERSAVLDLTHKRPPTMPDAQGAAPTSIPNAVGRDFIDREHQVSSSILVQVRFGCTLGYTATQCPQ